jgi:uncharacterized protein with ParB-like and HNH nuclease domain
MEANKRMLYDDIIKKSDVQYVIPVYQRNYTWDKENCDQLFDDIIYSIKNNRNHYIGSLVYVNLKKSGNSDDIKICSIIDGQQRLTTVMLLLKAIQNSINDKDNIISKKIEENLYNKLCEERYKLKLKNVDGDNDDLEKVLSGNVKGLNETSKIAINYKNFVDRINNVILNSDDNISYSDLLSGISKLEIVEIILDEDDNPQKIFESINSTGKYLTNPDLIRNFLLMGIIDPGIQKEYYRNYWVELENKISSDNIEKFFYDFLIMKDPTYIKEDKVYDNFKKYYDDVNDKDYVFKEILRYGEYYKLILCCNSKLYSKKTNQLCRIFTILKHNTIYSFLLRVCDDFKDIQKLYDAETKNILTEDEIAKYTKEEIEFNNILELFNVYAVRRLICEIPSSSLRRFYAGLYNKLFGKNDVNKTKYYESCKAYLCTLKTDDAMPDDNMFRDSLYYKNIFKKSNILRYFFDLIENNGTKEKVDMSDLTIEHYLPQTLNESWKLDLGKERAQDVYDKYVHTLGNLSITGYNSEYSNNKYSDKKDAFKNYISENKVKILKLNQELLDEKITKWDEPQILNRANRLYKEILKFFPYPSNIDNSLEFEKYYEFYLIDSDSNADETDTSEEYFGNPKYKLYGFKYKDDKVKSDSLKAIYVDIIKMLYNKDKSIIGKLADDEFVFEHGSRVCFSRNEQNQYMTKVYDNLYVETNYNREMIFFWIKELFNKYQLDINDFSILFIDKI